MDTNNFEEKIKPFFWVEHSNSYSVCLNAGEYKSKLFETRASEGFEGNGYDWTSLARVFLSEKAQELTKVVNFDPEGSMFSAYSEDKTALKSFITSFKTACENDELIQDLFSRAEMN